MSNKNLYSSYSDSELDFMANHETTTFEAKKSVLEEIHRRKNIKEQKVSKDQRTIKILTIVILVIALLTLVATIVVPILIK